MTGRGRDDTDAGAPATDIRGALAGAGEVGRALLRVDWAATSLGEPEAWPHSLRTLVRVVVDSRFSMWMAWGPDLTFFCNDAYRRDTLGNKYPWALGRPASEVWAEIWEDIGPRIAAVMRSGVATWDRDLMLVLERHGYSEETYHTFSYSPLTDDEGVIVGMLCVVTEDTDRVISERRMATLRDLGAETAAGGTEADVCALVSRVLSDASRDLPFSATYLFDGSGAQAHLAAVTGASEGDPVAPAVVTADDEAPAWPVSALFSGTGTVVGDLGARFDEVPNGPWGRPPAEALVVPLAAQTGTAPLGFLVAGLNPLRPRDASFAAFVHLVAGQIAARLAAIRALEAERQRAENLAALDRAKTTFFTNISHEFRTPLTLLLGPAEEALADSTAPLAPAQASRLQVIHRNAQRLLTLVNELLDFSRLEAGRTVERFEPVDLGQVTASLASMFANAAERAGVALVVDCPPLRETVYVDLEMWTKVVLNLLSNALKFTFDGSITVRVEAEGSAARLTVSDTGAGIAPAEHEHLFERFHRVAGVRSRTHEGSGIGLALVAELVALHGGSVSVDSEVGRGSTFRVELPLGAGHLPLDHLVASGDSPAAARDEHAAGFVADIMRWIDPAAGDPAAGDLAAPPEHAGDLAAPPEQDGEARSGTCPVTGPGRPRVLVADDNADMRRYVADLLSQRYEVRTAADGAIALDMARSWAPDLVLTDVMMPNLDGFGLLAELHADPSTLSIPVVMLSARAGDDGTVEGLEAGADDYLTKPFSSRELLARVGANLELERARRTRRELERTSALLDNAERLARIGSWESAIDSGQLRGSAEYFRLHGVDPAELVAAGTRGAMRMVHHDDRDRVRRVSVAAATSGQPLDVEYRIVRGDGEVRVLRSRAVVVRDGDGDAGYLRGSIQDVTELRHYARVEREAAVAAEAAAREHAIAHELQLSLLPPQSFDPDHLQVATFYRAGVEGTQVGGDWYDVIDLGAGRTALVLGDVMGRGVGAATVMGQLRSAVRAYARLDLPPADVLEYLDGVVRDIGEDHIVTCVYAVYDPADRSVTLANAGHLPPLVASGGEVVRVAGGAGPPLGTGPLSLIEDRVTLPVGATIVLYTDGLVERRDQDLDRGIDVLVGVLETSGWSGGDLPATLVQALALDEVHDDVAILVARVRDEPGAATSATTWSVATVQDVAAARHFAAKVLTSLEVGGDALDDGVLVVSELVTNAVIHGGAPVELRLRRSGDHVVIDVHDATTVLPKRLRVSDDDEHGRGLNIVASVAERWGTRPTGRGKSVWCSIASRP